MNDIIDKYIEISNNNLNIILKNLENNIEFNNNNLWSDEEEFSSLIKNVIDIYYKKYFLYTKNDYSKIDKYIKFNNKINRKLKNILLSIIDYYEEKDIVYKIKEQEDSILYLTVLIYISINLYDKDFKLIDNPKKIEKYINNIIDNFVNIRFKRNKDLVTLIQNIKDIIIKNNEFNNYINNISTRESHNYFIKVNNKDNLYKVIYEYEINGLNDYEERDINIVNNKINISDILNGISYDIAYLTSYKLLKSGIDKVLLFKVKKEELMNKEILNYMINRNKIVNSNIKFLIDYDDINGDYDLVNKIKDSNIDVYIELNKNFETNNYNMFMDLKNVIVSEEFLSLNDKYIEIWKDMNIDFIIKDYRDRILEKELIGRK